MVVFSFDFNIFMFIKSQSYINRLSRKFYNTLINNDPDMKPVLDYFWNMYEILQKLLHFLKKLNLIYF